MVARNIHVRDRRVPLLLEDRLCEVEVLGSRLVNEVAVDHEEIGLCRLDLTEGTARALDRGGLRIARHELRIAHDSNALRAIRNRTDREERRVVDGLFCLAFHRLGGRGSQVRDRHVALVLRTGAGLHEAHGVDRKRLREALRHVENDLRPAIESDVVAVDVRLRTLRIDDLEAWPHAIAIALDVRAERERVALERHGFVRDEVVAAGRGFPREIELHADRWILAVLARRGFE